VRATRGGASTANRPRWLLGLTGFADCTGLLAGESRGLPDAAHARKASSSRWAPRRVGKGAVADLRFLIADLIVRVAAICATDILRPADAFPGDAHLLRQAADIAADILRRATELQGVLWAGAEFGRVWLVGAAEGFIVRTEADIGAIDEDALRLAADTLRAIELAAALLVFPACPPGLPAALLLFPGLGQRRRADDCANSASQKRKGRTAADQRARQGIKAVSIHSPLTDWLTPRAAAESGQHRSEVLWHLRYGEG